MLNPWSIITSSTTQSAQRKSNHTYGIQTLQKLSYKIIFYPNPKTRKKYINFLPQVKIPPNRLLHSRLKHTVDMRI